MRDKPDILDQLADFERHGNTATERLLMRMEAYNEIRRLRGALKAVSVTVALPDDKKTL